MNISAIALRATRAVHSAAVGLHVKALRLSVFVAEEKARVLSEEADIAAAAARAAQSMSVRAHVEASRAAFSAAIVRDAARQEACNLGGSL